MPARKHIVRPSYVQAQPDQGLFDFEAFDLKRCTGCDQYKPMIQFHLWNKSPDGRQPRCKACRTRLEGSESYNAELARRQAGLKRCRTCGLEKPFDDFHRQRLMIDGYRANCKACRQPERLAQSARVRERNILLDIGFVLPTRPERVARPAKPKAKAKVVIDYRIAWLEGQRDVILARAAAYRRLHRLRFSQKQSLRKALKQGSCRQAITESSLAAKMAYWGNRCWMCGGPPETIDHVKPLSKGGPHLLANLRPACNSCNCSKQAKWPYPTTKGY